MAGRGRGRVGGTRGRERETGRETVRERGREREREREVQSFRSFQLVTDLLAVMTVKCKNNTVTQTCRCVCVCRVCKRLSVRICVARSFTAGAKERGTAKEREREI